MATEDTAGGIRQDSESELLARLRTAPEGDIRAFEILVDRYKRRIVSNCRHLSGDRLIAEDLAQEVFVKAYFGVARFEERASFRSWLYRIKINHCLNFLRSREAAQFVDLEEVDLAGENASPGTLRTESPADSHQLRERIGKVLDMMAETLRVPLILRDMDGLSYEEISSSLGISLSATKMRIKRAREVFRFHFQKLGSPAEAD